jgi:hypothetical protein
LLSLTGLTNPGVDLDVTAETVAPAASASIAPRRDERADGLAHPPGTPPSTLRDSDAGEST